MPPAGAEARPAGLAGLGLAAAPSGTDAADAAGPAIDPAGFAAAPVAGELALHTGNDFPGADPVGSHAAPGADLADGPGDADDADGAAEPGSAGFLAHALVEQPARRVIPIGLLTGSGTAPAFASGTVPPGAVPPGAIPERERTGTDLQRLAGRAAAMVGLAARAGLAWAARRQLRPTSMTGISLALAACAAAWFSAGTTTGMIRGAAAFGIAYLVLVTAGKVSPRQAPAFRLASPELWLAALGGCLVECVAYAGLAAGAAAAGWSGMWPLAVAALGIVAVRNVMTACSTPPGFGERSGFGGRFAAAALTMPPGGRVLLVGVVAPVWGARVALLALVDWAIISIGYGLAGRASAPEPGALPGAGPVPGSTGAAGVQGAPGGTPGPSGQPDPVRESGPARQPGPTSPLIRLRDDGVLARSLGGLVRGSLLPLPPAMLGIVAVAALALVGLHGLPGALMIAPAIVMLLAAPGSANAHAGRFDFLVPVLLLGAQILYLGSIGLARGVPGPVVFALTAVLLLRYADLAFPGRPVMLAGQQEAGRERAERGSALGWEGRVLIAGLAAAMGIATLAYVALAAYLGLLICAKAVTSCLVLQEDAPRDRPGYGSRRGTPPAP